MIFDDHEVGDDWNISAAWVEEMRQHPYWNDQIIGGYASYWIYQHLGNLSPEELDRDDLYKSVRDAEDAWPVLRDFAYRTHRVPDGTRWSYHRDLGNTRLLMIDARGGRVLEEDRRSMVDAEEWAWIVETKRPATSTTSSLAPRSLCYSVPRCTTSRAGTRSYARAPGEPAPPAGQRVSAAPRTSTTGHPSTTHSPLWWA